MKVRLLVSRAGEGFAQHAGDIIEVGNAEAKRMLNSDPPQCEPAAQKPSQRAEKRALRRGRESR